MDRRNSRKSRFLSDKPAIAALTRAMARASPAPTRLSFVGGRFGVPFSHILSRLSLTKKVKGRSSKAKRNSQVTRPRYRPGMKGPPDWRKRAARRVSEKIRLAINRWWSLSCARGVTRCAPDSCRKTGDQTMEKPMRFTPTRRTFLKAVASGAGAAMTIPESRP